MARLSRWALGFLLVPSFALAEIEQISVRMWRDETQGTEGLVFKVDKFNDQLTLNSTFYNPSFAALGEFRRKPSPLNLWLFEKTWASRLTKEEGTKDYESPHAIRLSINDRRVPYESELYAELRQKLLQALEISEWRPHNAQLIELNRQLSQLKIQTYRGGAKASLETKPLLEACKMRGTSGFICPVPTGVHYIPLKN
jgi:hypothetical protein